jgi:tetratricopeptide (TPR) repeat protein
MKTYAPETLIANRYEVAGQPLMGGMGIVYICLDHAQNRPIALKTFKPEYLPDRAARDRFLREGTTWVNLGSHSHIVRCYEVIRDQTGLEVYLALELIDKAPGREDASLRSWLFPGHPLPLQTALLFALQIARGMQHAAARIPGFVHRDLKPENVLVGADYLPGTFVNRLRVTDFGLASVLQDAGGKMQEAETGIQEPSCMRHTQLTHGIVGTPLYMAPEQWAGATVGVYTDVYALGCILYEMLTGYTAADGDSRDDLERAHCTGDLRPFPDGIPAPVRYLLARCLAFAPADRYLEWDNVEFVLRNVYAAVTGESAPPQADAATLSHQERVAAGWSYNTIGSSYLDIGKAEVAVGYFERAAAVGQAEGEQALEGAALGNLGLAYARLGDVRQAIEYYEQALVIDHEIGDRRGESATLGNLGSAYLQLGDARRAIRFHEQHLEIACEITDRWGVANALGNMGSVYLQLGDVRRAIECYEQALVIDHEIGDRRGEGVDLCNMGLAYTDLGDARRAIVYYEQALEIAREIGDRRSESATLGNMGEAYRNLGDVRRAIGFSEQQLVIAREIGDWWGESIALGNMGETYRDLGDTQQAIGLYQQCLTIRREIGDRHGEASTCWNLGLLYEKQGDLMHAVELMQICVDFEREVGHPDAEKDAEYLARLHYTNVNQQAFEAFRRADSLLAMQRAVAHFPLMIDPEFIAIGEQAIAQQIPPEIKPAFQQQLVWLQQIARERK